MLGSNTKRCVHRGARVCWDQTQRDVYIGELECAGIKHKAKMSQVILVVIFGPIFLPFVC